VADQAPQRWAAYQLAEAVVRRRTGGRASSAHDGDLGLLAPTLAGRFGPRHAWSASRLEAYRTCPFFFFVGSVLALEPRAEPVEGLDVRQLGNIYHRIFERLFEAVEDGTDGEALRAALPPVARQVLDAAPRVEGFRVTAWWARTRAEIVRDIERSLEALLALPGNWVPAYHEAPFGLRGAPALAVTQGGDRFCLRGLIDRVDRDETGGVRVIDYKTAGSSTFRDSAVRRGDKLQLPLYALAARDALRMGEPRDGFYWHVRSAEPSPFTLAGFEGGPEDAIGCAVGHAWEAVRGARAGHFVPRPPDGGCPSYCPAAGFCWHARTRRYGD
jgi:RecB family exonuclease